MKQRFFPLLMVLLLLSSSLLGCTGGTPAPAATPTEAAAAPTPSAAPQVEPPAGYTAGSYTASARGHNANITVTITTSEDAITGVTVDEHKESVGIGTWAVAMMPGRIVEQQSLAVDTVAGATITSAAIAQAVADCVEQANGDVAALQAKTPVTPAQGTQELATDVLVIGGGGTGLAASIEAARGGANVILLEMLDYLGGDTGRAGGGVEAAGTTFQEANGISDKPADFAAFIRSRGVSYRNPALLDTMMEQSADAIYFLADLGADMSAQVAGHGSPVARAHRPASGPAGQNIVQPMISELPNLPIKVYYSTPAYELVQDASGAVTGAKAKDTRTGQEYVITAKATVIATGNFASNNDMLAQYDPRLKGIGTNSSAGSQGDGIVMATAVGADLENMEIMRIRPTLPSAAANWIAVSQDGKRFMNETNSSDTIFVKGDDLHIQAIADKAEKHYWIFLDDASYQAQIDSFASYTWTSPALSAATLDEIAAEMKVDAAALKATVEEWNTMVANQKDTAFGRASGMDAPIGDGPYWAIKTRPTAHTTAGGIRINTDAQVLDANEAPIPGLYAGGEVTGGVHDGVSACCGAIVYGRICGISAAAHATK